MLQLAHARGDDRGYPVCHRVQALEVMGKLWRPALGSRQTGSRVISATASATGANTKDRWGICNLACATLADTWCRTRIRGLWRLGVCYVMYMRLPEIADGAVCIVAEVTP
jgi:hypothetical protein